MAQTGPQRAPSVTLSKKRWAVLQTALTSHDLGLTDAQVDRVLDVTCHALGFDPGMTTYDVKHKASMIAWRAKKNAEAKAMGISTVEMLARERACKLSARAESTAT